MVLQSSQDGGAAVSVSKRKTKPGKSTKAHKATTSTSSPEVRVDVDGRAEIVDPDEERYCICGDVSYGEMICCELEEKVSLCSYIRYNNLLISHSANTGCGFIWTVWAWSSFFPGL
jgi:hypothetical protein